MPMKELPEYIGYLLIQVMKAHRRHAEPELNALGIHLGQEMLLFRLWDKDGVTHSEIAECICVEPPTVTKMLQRMETAGLIERRQDNQDARVSRVYLTPKGRELEIPVSRVWQDLETITVKGLSESEKLLLRRLLMQIRENLDDTDT
jgi:DNA-binding MarR family transcriptional regulator